MIKSIIFLSPYEAQIAYDHRERLTVRCSEGGVASLVAELLSPLGSRTGLPGLNADSRTSHGDFLLQKRCREDTVVVKSSAKGDLSG